MQVQTQKMPRLKWDKLSKYLANFPPPEISFDSAAGFAGKGGWVFRGLQSSSYDLEPSIEREAKKARLCWQDLEVHVSHAFKERARFHLSIPLIPSEEDELAWLAQMQHYGIPTRLLDFTYSPFIALYFAVRHGYEGPRRKKVRLWAVNATAVNDRFRGAALEASGERNKIWNLDPDTIPTRRENMLLERKLIDDSLCATGERLRIQNKRGCACVASPPILNTRLASQQGVFLVNCTDELNLWDSLARMMGSSNGWYKIIDIPISLIRDIQIRLFQMNIHEQSLFPDIEGLAGFIRQKIQLHW